MKNSLPPCKLYSYLLDLAMNKFSITRDKARNNYGRFTTQQWENLLGITLN